MGNFDILLFVILTLIVVGGFIFAIFQFVTPLVGIFKMYKQSQQQQGPEVEKSFSPKTLCSWKEYEETVDGLTIRYRWAGGDHGPGYFLWKIPFYANGEFFISRKFPAMGLFQRLGVGKTVQIGDVEFDEKFSVQSPNPDFVRSFFLSSEKKEAIKKLFSMGFYDLKVNKGILEIKIFTTFGYGYDPAIPREIVDQHLQVLGEHLQNPVNLFKLLGRTSQEFRLASAEDLKKMSEQREEFLKDAVSNLRILMA